MRRVLVAILLAGAAQALSPLAASAHFGPAEPPDFGAPECIVKDDLRVAHEVMLSYDLGFDDTEPEIGHIWIMDSKTHQFFAFRGTVLQALPRYYYWPFTLGTRTNLPIWMDRDELLRADAANDPSVNPDFHAADIGNNVLAERTDVAGQWLKVSQRMPITLDQASKGVRWDLTGVAPGIYQIASYTFSPPFNAWEPRPGVIKVFDGTVEPAAVTVDSIDGMLYSGQGRSITGCVDAPAGSTLSLSYSLDDENESDWKPWRKDVPVQNGHFDVCFSSPDPQLSGLVRLRVGVKTPAGLETQAYSPDRLVVVSSALACSAGDSHCCQPPPPPMEPVAPPPVVMQPTAAGSNAPAPPQPGLMESPPTAAASGSCSAAPSSHRGSPLAWMLLLLAALVWASGWKKR